ncbi:MAG: acetyl-CoA decarbonylase/synthase complex subunit gamma, partial [Anaerolineales bacterium]|nr:acetyl-CoA decarbonylase/synthase complex subunit gamma [Anaerolineales bacterium]
LTGLDIYKLLPQTNCKECGFPTCLAFAMKLAAKQAELKSCPHVSDTAKAKLEAAAAPSIRLVTVAGEGGRLEAGNETVLFRHEKTFYHRPGLFVRVKASAGAEAIEAAARALEAYLVDYVGIKLGVDGIAVEADAPGVDFGAAVAAARRASRKPLILMADQPDVLAQGAQAAAGVQPLLYAAAEANWQAMAEIAKAAKCPLAVKAPSLEKLAELTAALKQAGVEDLVLDPLAREPGPALQAFTQLRRLAVKKGFRALGYPLIAFPGEAASVDAVVMAAQAIAKYAGFIVIDGFDPAAVYPLLVLRQNIYTDPQKPIQVQPGLYEINNPGPDAPLMVTTNFSITYFAVNNEVEGSGWPGWLVVTDAEGMSVLTAWAAGKFDADRIAKAVNGCAIAGKLNHKRLILPGQVAVLSGELEEALPGWQIMVGPKEAVDLPGFLKLVWGQKTL